MANFFSYDISFQDTSIIKAITALMMQAVTTSETTQSYIPEDSLLNNQVVKTTLCKYIFGEDGQ